MDNKGTYHLNDNKMDARTVWKWRILHVRKYSRDPEPFHYSDEIGLDFNIACSTQKKLDLQLVTNGVILEVCDFAKTVSKNKRHFITNILENNFSLGLENEQQRSHFTAQILHKVKDLIRNPPEDKHEVFTLFDVSSKPGSTKNSNNVQKMLSTECKTKGFLVEMDDSDDGEHEDELECSEATSNEYIKTGGLSDEMDRAHCGDSEQCSGVQSKKELRDASFPHSFPHCEEIGLNLDTDSNQNLDPSLLTKGVMLEVVHFTRILAASYSRIILDVLEHNFELDLKNQLVTNRVSSNISHLLKRRKKLTTVGNKITPEFKNEPFFFQTFARHHDKRGLCTSEEQIQTPQIVPNKADMKQEEMGAESSYSCAPGKSDRDSYDGTDFFLGKTGIEDHYKNRESCSLSSDFPKSESSCLGLRDTFLVSTDVSSSLPTVNSNVNSPFTSQHDERGLCGGGEQTPSPQSVLKKCDTEQEEMITENDYTFPLGESDIDSDERAGLQNTSNGDHLENPEIFSLSSKIPPFTSQLDKKWLCMEQEGCPNNPNLEPCSAGSSRPTIKDQNVGSSVDNEANLKLWKVRTNCNQQMPSPNKSVINSKKNHGSKREKLDLKPLFASQSDARGLCTAEAQTQTARIVPRECDVKQEEIKTENYYSCPRRESDIDSDEGADSQNTGNQDHFEHPESCSLSSDNYKQLESNCMDVEASILTTTDVLSPLPTVNSKPTFTYPPVEKGLNRSGEQTQIPRKAPNKCDIEQEGCQNNPNLEPCSAGSSRPTIKDQNVGSSVDNEANLKLWKVRTNCNQQMPSPNKSVINSKKNHGSKINLYPICKEIGLDLDMASQSEDKEKLDLKPRFASQSDAGGLCTVEAQTQTARIVPRECDVKQEEIKTENYYSCPIRESDIDSDAGADSQNTGHQDHWTDWRETIQKRKLALQIKQKRSTLVPNKSVVKSNKNNGSKGNLYDEDSDKGTDSENTGNEDHSEHPESCSVSSDLPKSESSCLGMHDTFLTSTDVSSSLPTVNSDVNSPFTSQHDERGLCGGGEQTPSPQSVLNKWDMEQEEIGTKANIWKLRSNRVEQIVSPLNKEFAQFHVSKRAGIEFNVGFGPKQNISVDSLTNSALHEIVKFALAINSSQKEFIMEILEYNFDLGIQSPNQRYTFTREIMKRVRQLRCFKDAVKFSNEVFELPGPRPSINMANQSEGNVIPQLSSVSRMEKRDVGFSSSADSHGESKEPIPHKSEDLYPFCKEIGLKLRVNNSQPNRKLEINVLTNGAMTEVTNFAEKLCGTFEEICLDILRHNFDLDQSGDSDAAKNILARIPVLVEQKNLSTNCPNVRLKKKGGHSFDFKNNPNLGTCSSPDPEYKKEINLKLWKVRTKQIQHILSMPHEEDCPLYSYSRCKKLGIDFNVGSGVKQNLDPKFLTNGVMAELNAFVVALISSTKHFVTEILEFNFNLDLKDELYRSAFTQEIGTKLRSMLAWKKSSETRLKIPFELPDTSCIQEPFFDRTTYCPRCYQERNHKLWQDESDAGHVNPFLQSMTDTVSADENYSTKKLAKDTSSTFSAAEETIMNSRPHCKKIGLTLCVDKNQPTDKLDTHFLTRGVMMEVENFAKKLCGTRIKILDDLLEHNFNISMQQTRFIDFGKMHCRVMAEEDGGLAYFNEVFVFPAPSQREPGHVGQMSAATLATQRSDWRETIQKRKLALQTKRKRSTLRPENYYTCPIGESDLESDEGTDTENTGNEDHSEHPESCSVSSDLPKSESSCLGVHDIFLASTDVSSNLPAVNSDVNSPFTSQRDERGLCGGEEQTPSPQSVLNKWDMEQEEMGTEANIWKLRSNRVEQIISPLNKEIAQLQMSKRAGIGFNVGFGPKQNKSVDSLTNGVLLEIAKFALAINSSQKEFIMEILEYNFDFGLQSPNQRNTFTHEIMKRVRQLRCCKDAVKFSNEVFELPGPRPSINMANQSEGSVIPQLSSVSRMEKRDVGFSSSADSHGESKEPIPHKSEDLYPVCKEIGLKLCVNNSQPNRKLEINVLTNGAMTEVTNFAEKLCGTFEEICLDILGHNFDLDFQSGDSDAAKNILARIPVLVEQKNLSAYCPKVNNGKKKGIICLDYKNNPNLDACSPGSSPAAMMDQSEGSSPDIEHKKEINLKLWKVRTKQIQHILSMPHEEHCPLYSYSRCKKIGIDFNVGSGVKQNLDPKFLTNGIMAELNAFVVALLSSTKHFITEILEFNFNLDLKDELHRSAFTQEIVARVDSIRYLKNAIETRLKIPFELPDMSCIQEPSFDRTTYCPRCYQERNHKLGQDESDAGHVNPCLQSMTDTVSANENYSTKKPAKDTSSTFSAIEEIIMNCNLRCKKIGLTLCVDKNQPTDKLDTHFLTRGVMMEVENFAKKLCGTRIKILHDLLEHNFNISMQQTRFIHFGKMHRRVMAEEDSGLAYFDEVFVFPARLQSEPGHVGQMSAATLATQRSDWRETIQKRKIALQTKEERATLPNPNKSVVKSMKNNLRKRNLYPICTEIGLDLDVTSKSEEKEKLDLNILTVAVVYEIHKFVTNNRSGHYFPSALFDILDYNFDLSLQHHRRWEFAIAAASEVQTILRRYRQNREQADKVFKLPFVFAPKKQSWYSRKKSGKYICAQQELQLGSNEVTDSRNAGCQDHSQNPTSADTPRESNSSCHIICASLPTTADIFALPAVNSNVNPLFESQSDKRGQTQTAEIAPHNCDVKQKDTEQEEIGMEINMWKLRSNRVEQIVSPLNKEFGLFHISKKLALEFNVGFGPKQNISVDSLTNSVLLKIAKFAIAINSSQKEFIMEILEYNFDLGIQSPNQRNTFTREVMKRVRQLRCREDAVKFSNEGFEHTGPGPSINMANQSEGNVIPQLSSVSRMEKRDVGFSSSADSHGESKEPIPHKSEDLYPFCKEIGLKLCVNNSQPNRKLEINVLTNGAMTEVTNFAEKLCGTFEEICLDILRHNFDLQSGDSDAAKNILARIPVLVEQNNLSAYCPDGRKMKKRGLTCMDFMKSSNLDACSPGSSQAAMMDQNESRSADTEHNKEINLKMWKMRTKQIQHILSIPHEEHCPLYSYSRCKKLGIDFNVGSGVKQNLDPKFLTNGIMAELNAFVVALLSSTKHFITEILEFNFNLDLKDELHRIAFAETVLRKLEAIHCRKKASEKWPIPFELPVMSCIQEPTFDRTTYCPRCYQERNHKLGQDESDAGHVNPCLQSMTDTVSANENYSTKKPAKDTSSTFSGTEETIMNCNPRCKKIGLTLCVDKNQPTDKLDTHLLTYGVMMEVGKFAQKLCGTRVKVFRDLLEHNFNISMQQQTINFGKMHRTVMAEEDGGLAYFNEVFVFPAPSQREPGHVSQMSIAALATQRNDWRETIQKRKIALQTKVERATLPNPNKSVVKSKKNNGRKRNLYPICTEIGLDLDVTSKSEEKEKLDLNLLTVAVIYEIHKFITRNRSGHYFPGALFDILDYNFDLSSQHHRRWEFALAAASEVQTILKQYRINGDLADKVCKLPLIFHPRASQSSVQEKGSMKRKRSSQDEPGKKRKKGWSQQQVSWSLDVNPVNFVCGPEPYREPSSHDKDTNCLTDPWMINAQSSQIPATVNYGSPLPLNIVIKEEEYNPHDAVMKTEPVAEEKYHPHYYNVKTESNSGDVGHLVPDESAGSLGCTSVSMCPNTENVKTESENEVVQYYILAQPQGSQGLAMLTQYWSPVEVAASHGESMIPVCQNNDSTSIKEEQENMLIDSYN